MTASISTGTLFKVGNAASPEVFSTVAQAKEVKWSGASRKVIDSYVHGSSYPVRMLGPHDPQNVELKLLFDGADAAHEALRGAGNSGTTGNYQIVLPDPGSFTITFTAYVTKFEIETLTADGAEIVANVTLEFTALPTVTP